MTAFYNEIDPYCAQWLRNLIDAGHIAPGVVDERSIEDITPNELREYTQVHCFAGIGVWSYALRLAGWPDDRPVWTGSCPCQPFSAAGKGHGFADERHLWPTWQHLIAQCRPPIVFGEQVASNAVDAWIDLVHADMEGMGYAFGCVPFPSAGIGAPHIRDRNYWVAYASRERLAQRIGDRRIQCETLQPFAREATVSRGTARRMGNAELSPQERQQQHGGQVVSIEEAKGLGLPSALNGFWRHGHWIACADGKSRPVEPGTFPLVDGAPNRVGRLRAYGNAINAEAAATFIRAYLDSRSERMTEAA